MNYLDWLVLAATVLFITLYGLWRNRRSQNITEYLLADRSLPWYTVAFSIIATQASAITFLSAPGQAYFDGVRFVQFYLGLPLAMWVIAKVFVPRYYGQQVVTAYQLLEEKFDWRVRALTACLFLIQRGLAAGLVISAPCIILNQVLGWNFYLVVLAMGGIVVLYTTVGGSKAISQTQFQQMLIILLGMIVAGIVLVWRLPEAVGLGDALGFAAKAGKMKVLDFGFDWKNKYNVWSGLIGGFFLSLAYFGTDQSQVERYISAKSVKESQRGLFFNALFKLPMQFGILTLGALLFVFFQLEPAPIFFKSATLQQLPAPELQTGYQNLQAQNRQNALTYLAQPSETNFNTWQQQQKKLEAKRNEYIALAKKQDPYAEDKNYVFLYYVLNYLPHGLIGLLIAVIFFAAMSTASSEMNALASVSLVDIYQRFFVKSGSDRHYVNVSKLLTVLWALLAVGFALSIRSAETLIETINQIGSLFYGVILGIFLLAFFSKGISAKAVLLAAVVVEAGVLLLHLSGGVSYLWYNAAGCVGMLGVAWLLAALLRD